MSLSVTPAPVSAAAAAVPRQDDLLETPKTTLITGQVVGPIFGALGVTMPRDLVSLIADFAEPNRDLHELTNKLGEAGFLVPGELPMRQIDFFACNVKDPAFETDKIRLEVSKISCFLVVVLDSNSANSEKKRGVVGLSKGSVENRVWYTVSITRPGTHEHSEFVFNKFAEVISTLHEYRALWPSPSPSPNPVPAH